MAPYPKRTKHRHDDHATWDQAEWNQAVRGETELETRDRQFTELVQEPRVAQTGVQILFAFLLGLAFTPAFPTSAAPSRASTWPPWSWRRCRRRC
jgi:Family of unknown function (DUF6328)